MGSYTPKNIFDSSSPPNINVRGDTGPTQAPIKHESNRGINLPMTNGAPPGGPLPLQNMNGVGTTYQNGPLPDFLQREFLRSPQDDELAKDIASRIPGLYRVFDLISEQGSGGLVDKVIIAQDGLKRLINDLCPGAYVALTRVDFKALDTLTVHPIGIYGDRGEIIKFLSSLCVADETTTQLLRHSKDDYSGPTLRSGIYIVRPPGHSMAPLYAIYWPQDTTWNDNAPSGPRRNRITFMRYLTKISDQILCLMSPTQSEAFVWDHQEEEGEDLALDYIDIDDEDRLYTFEITKTNEQEEGVVSRPGFTFDSPLMQVQEGPHDENQVHLPPRLMLGERSQAFLSAEALPPRIDWEVTDDTFSAVGLCDLLRSSVLRIHCELEDDAISALIKNTLAISPYKKHGLSWQERKRSIDKDMEKQKKERMVESKKQLVAEGHDARKMLMTYLVGFVLEKFPTIDPARLTISPQIASSDVADSKDKFVNFLKAIQAENILPPNVSENFMARLTRLPVEFLEQKKRVVCVHTVLVDHPQCADETTIRNIIKDGFPGKFEPKQSTSWFPLPFFSSGGADGGDVGIENEIEDFCKRLSDEEFLANLDDYVQEQPLAQPATRRASELAYDHFSSTLTRTFGFLIPNVLAKKREFTESQVAQQCNADKQEAFKNSNQLFCRDINSTSEGNPSSTPVIILERMNVVKHRFYETYDIIARQQFQIKSTLQYTINKLEIPGDHRHKLQLDPSFIPQPSISRQGSITFTLPPPHQILHAQLVGADRALFVVDQDEKFGIYLDNIHSIGNALQNTVAKKSIHKRRLGYNVLVAFDETKRLLVLCAPQKATLHVFMFDERFSTLQSWASPFELAGWYNNGETITHICFMSGTEELLLVDSRTQARMYSFVSQRFRPASISLPAIPVFVTSSPDAACALFVFETDDQRDLVAYHWDTFGASDGMKVILPVSHGSVSVTSFVDRQHIHIMMLNEVNGCCESLALTITKKTSEFMFKEKGTKVSVDATKGGDYTNNCLIDCFADVWTRFPVVAAVSRHSIMSSSTRQPKRITFVTYQVHDKYASYFAKMAQTFEEQTKKPTDGQLRGTLINATTISATIQDLTVGPTNTVSQFLAGQWLMNLLCLLPIHIAVARDNRFVPLKDGVSSAEFEKSLLGAEVGRIVDNISFGWYEPILCSYMADKPVRVISSMGEQSVGKSFALNHLLDTSFAGSAMRTTEGVWMSITPTDDALLVALDFEGVHSIERSPQEDALLVLFNTAVSNLVLFRNNFAVSRDIADSFQSFQASSVILDPAANPSLFQSTLVIIIKDVIKSDEREIVREFSSKFQRIVQAEQGANFISRLHAGRLNIIPWPVIESSQFYTLYSTLKRRLDSQKITHPSAGEFLHTLKVLMAKLKANDWSAMSQSLAAHRAQTMLTILPIALQYGFAEAGFENEPLKNLDNDTVIDYPDKGLKLFLSSYSSELSSREAVLADLKSSWIKYNARHDMEEPIWMNELTAYLNEVVKLRVAHVEAWISANLQHFKSSNANVELLQREMANAVVDLQANVDLCKMTCASCHLSCTLSRMHDLPQQLHDCSTNHQCPHTCDYSDDHPGEFKYCHSPAGHDGPHICIVNLHLCGKPCIHQDKKGCQQDCTKMAGHDGDHICPARQHLCGQPCALRVGVIYACEGTCSFPSDEPHDQHVCDNRMCPMTCELCKRLCGSADHLHGLDETTVHLCGETHRCQALCTAAGICEIDTTPQSIEATFTGRHETFQYTKYSQAAKRLPCVKPIPAGKREHQGQHVHSLDPAPFHFCEARCENCGYYCTLPRGHTQQEHETSHGSMSKTRWAVEGPDGAAMELNGRRFGADDEGAPMMCNLVCQSMGRHAHIDYCRTDASQHCAGQDHEHIPTRLAPNPDRPKDWISHNLNWRRSGFKDPYSRDDQASFAKCDSMCAGPEHAATTNQHAQPSNCTLPLFHLPYATNQPAGLGYVSSDGHLFSCKNPVVLQQAFHVIFVVDRSRSMRLKTSTPLPSTPVTPAITRRHNNRLGAVYLSLHGFWQSRQTALTNPGSRAQGQAAPARRDAYSVILFNSSVTLSFQNDFQSTPEDLLENLLQYETRKGTNYEAAVLETEAVMRRHWSSERSPVVIFLSDGQCSIRDSTVRTLCRASISLGKPLSFHAVSFGPSNQSLRRMARIAREVESTAPGDATLPANAHVESSYAEALDSVRLAETFLGIADSLKKTRGALMA